MALRSGSGRNKINERDLERIPTSVPRSGDGYGSKEEFDQARAKESIERAEWKLDAEALSRINTRKGLIELLDANRIDVDAVLSRLRCEEELRALQVELVKLQRRVQAERRRIAIIVESRDAAGKGGTIPSQPARDACRRLAQTDG